MRKSLHINDIIGFFTKTVVNDRKGFNYRLL